MRLGFRENNTGVTRIVEFDSAMIWPIGRSYDEANDVFGGKNIKEWDRVLKNLEKVDYNTAGECIILYDSKSKLAPKFLDRPDLSDVKAEYDGNCTTARPVVVELFVYDERKSRGLFNTALETGYIDMKDFDAAMLTYENIPETSGNMVKKVLVDLTDVDC